MNSENYMQDYFEIIGDAIEDMRSEKPLVAEKISIPKVKFEETYQRLNDLAYRFWKSTATYREVEEFLVDLKVKMGHYI